MTNQLFGAPDPPRADGSNGSPRQRQWLYHFSDASVIAGHLEEDCA
jgi:hypothetical protein